MININDLIEVKLKDDSSFLKIKETLTRIGIASKKEFGSESKNVLYQTAHILHKRGRHYIVHFKEMFGLDGRECNMTEDDFHRRDAIANLLETWGLLTIVNREVMTDDFENVPFFKVISFDEKENWMLKPKYRFGAKRRGVKA